MMKVNLAHLASMREPVSWCKQHVDPHTWMCVHDTFVFVCASTATQFALIW